MYENTTAGTFGSIRGSLNVLFSSFILENKNIKSIVEVGAGNGELSDIILLNKKLTYTIVDPSFGGNQEGKHVINTYFENCDLNIINNDAVVMSQVFEHFHISL